MQSNEAIIHSHPDGTVCEYDPDDASWYREMYVSRPCPYEDESEMECPDKKEASNVRVRLYTADGTMDRDLHLWDYVYVLRHLFVMLFWDHGFNLVFFLTGFLVGFWTLWLIR